MKIKPIIFIVILVLLDFILIRSIVTHGHNLAILNPQGTIARGERNLMIQVVTLGMSAIIPTALIFLFIVRKYRSGNKNSTYDPEWRHSNILTVAWWLIPSVFIFFLATITWKSTHALDPYKPLDSNVKPITIQVIALRWKWLFIYPVQNIATVNFVEFPKNTPINFELTGDAPMSSFWIPQLGGQVYAMTGMSTKIHLQATSVGDFNGSTAEINGAGFAGMRFIAKSVDQVDFNDWVMGVQKSNKKLDISSYNKLAQPSEDNPQTFYSPIDQNIYNDVISKYMTPRVESEEKSQ
ncbi:MAG TPA: COX aromatic rich motif-containing protein [Patescibacteria group bacterium]|nr:COX aromatic rich motif-containing protein [Patescibacteria group bacterium]